MEKPDLRQDRQTDRQTTTRPVLYACRHEVGRFMYVESVLYEPAVYYDWSTSARDLITHQLDEAEQTQFVGYAVVGPVEVVEVTQTSSLLALHTPPSRCRLLIRLNLT